MILAQGWKALFNFFDLCTPKPLQLLILLSMTSFGLCRLFTTIWLQVWVDAGDGQEAARRANTTWLETEHTEEQWKGDLNYHPRLWLYQLVYGLIIVAMLIFGFLKGAGTMLTMTRGSLKVTTAPLRWTFLLSGPRAHAQLHHDVPHGIF